MENASKALLIAGAVLIAILLIGVGMLIFNGASENMDSALTSMNQQQIQAFNAPFEQYIASQKGSQVRALIGNIINSNSANQDVEGKLVSLEVKGVDNGNIEVKEGDLKTNEMSAIRSKINTGATYQVTLEFSSYGLVNKVIVEKGGTTGGSSSTNK